MSVGELAQAGLGLVFVIVAIAVVRSALNSGGRGRNGRSRGRASRSAGGRRSRGAGTSQSWLIKAWNASGAPEVKEKRLREVFPVVVGKLIGKAGKKYKEARKRRRDGQRLDEAANEAGRATGRAAQRAWSAARRRGGKDPDKNPGKRPGEQQPAGTNPPNPPSPPNGAGGPPPRPAPPPNGAGPQPASPTTPRREDPPMAPPRRPTFMTLFEASDTLARQRFASIQDVHDFVKTITRGTQVTANVYLDLSDRMAGPMHVDQIVTRPVHDCAGHQRVISEAVGRSGIDISDILQGTLEQLLERNVGVPRHGQLQAADREKIPAPRFFELVTGLPRHVFEDIRVVHCMIKALQDASVGQSVMYVNMRNRLIDEAYPRPTIERYNVAINAQNAISGLLAEADAAMTMLLNMTIQQLIESNYRAPNARMIDA